MVKRASAARPRFCSFLSSFLSDPRTINTSVPPSECLTLRLGINRHASYLLFVSSQHQETRFHGFLVLRRPVPSLLIDESYFTWTFGQPQLQHHSIPVLPPTSVASTGWQWSLFWPLCLILFGLIASVLFCSVSQIIIGSIRRLTSSLQQGGCPQCVSLPVAAGSMSDERRLHFFQYL